MIRYHGWSAALRVVVCLAVSLLTMSPAWAAPRLSVQLVVDARGAAEQAGLTPVLDSFGNEIRLEPQILLDDADVLDAHPDYYSNGEPAVALVLTKAGARKLHDISLTRVGRQLAFVLQGRVIATPVMNGPFNSEVVIVGPGKSIEDAQQLAATIAQRETLEPAPPMPKRIAAPLDVTEGGWTLWQGLGIALTYSTPDHVSIYLECTENDLRLALKGTPPAQAFPQPLLTLKIADSVWSQIPDAQLRYGEVSLVDEFRNSENVMRDRATMQAVAKGVPLEVSFGGKSWRTEPIPPAFGAKLSKFCLALWQLPE